MKGFFKHLETIGSDILKGISVAGPVVGTFAPAVGPILTQVAAVITNLEKSGQEINEATLSAITQAIAASHTQAQAQAAAPKE